MRKASKITASGKTERPEGPGGGEEAAGVKGGIVINWAASKPARPGQERGVIAIIKPVGGA